MNLAITTTSARTWKAVKAHYLAAIAGAALAVTSIAGAASLSIDWGGGDTVISRPLPPPAVLSEDQKYVTYYLVGSEAEREQIIAGENEAASERDSAGIREPNASFTVFVARTRAEVDSARLSIYEATSSFDGTDTIVNVVDRLSR